MGAHPITLRPYQRKCIADVRAAFTRCRRVVLVLPTGGGKTATASVLMRSAWERGKKCLFLVHRREIVLDTMRRLRAAGVPCGVIMAGQPTTDAPVQVASVQTIAARDLHPEADLVIIDEVHHVVCATHTAIVEQYPDAYHLGLTATPERSDRQGLRDAFDEIVVGSTIRELTELGALVPCDVLAPPKRRDALSVTPLEAWQRWAGGRPTVAFLDSIDSSETFVAELLVTGVRAAHLDGATPLQERDRILGDFAAGRIDVLSNVFVLTEGWDSPRAKVCLLARGTSSVGPYLQMIGRVLRPDGTGARALLIDLCGVVHQHGLPDEDRVWSLDGIKRTAEATQWIRQCAVCGSVFEGQEWPETCPSGHPFPARPPRKVKPEEVARVTSVVSRGEQQRYFDELSRAAERNGWKVTAVGMRFKMRFGFWPAGFRASRAGDVTERGAVG